MPDERWQELELSRFWRELLASPGGPVAGEGDLDPNLADTLRHLHAMSRTSPPAGASERLDRGMLPRLASPPNGKESTDMHRTHALSLPRSGIGPNRWAPRRTGPADSTGRARARLRWASAQIAMALLLLVTLVIGYVAYRDNRAAVIPPTPGTPTVVATPATHAWPTWGGNAARTRNMPGPAPLGQPVVLWTFPASGESGIGQIVDGATLVDGVLYVPGTSGFAALEAATGRELWRTTEVGGIGFIDGDGIVLRSAERSGNGYDLIRINRTDGSIAWRTEQGQIGDPWGPVVADGVGYVPSGTDLLAFDPATGNTVWRVPLGTPASRGVSEAGGLVVVGNQNGTVYGISVAGHDVVWKYETGSVVVGHPSLVGGTVYVFGRGGAPGAAIYALNAATGALEWRFAVPSGAILSNVAIGDGTVYTMSSDGEVYALDVATGADRWTFHIGAGGDANSPVLIGDDLFLVGGSGILYAVDATAGTERWHVSLGSHSTFTPVVVDGIAYVGTDMGTVLAIGGSGSAATPTR